jgi:hypothetical protein
VWIFGEANTTIICSVLTHDVIQSPDRITGPILAFVRRPASRPMRLCVCPELWRVRHDIERVNSAGGLEEHAVQRGRRKAGQDIRQNFDLSRKRTQQFFDRQIASVKASVRSEQIDRCLDPRFQRRLAPRAIDRA